MFARLELKLQAIPVSSLKGLEVFNTFIKVNIFSFTFIQTRKITQA
jgi:hypothetical protein